MLLVNQDLDWLLGKIPMDPFFSLGLITLSFAGLGWLSGPSLGNSLFYTFKSGGGVKTAMALKEAEFFARIRKNRVDPSSSSVANPGMSQTTSVLRNPLRITTLLPHTFLN